jgi:hypothetical protein
MTLLPSASFIIFEEIINRTSVIIRYQRLLYHAARRIATLIILIVFYGYNTAWSDRPSAVSLKFFYFRGAL